MRSLPRTDLFGMTMTIFAAVACSGGSTYGDAGAADGGGQGGGDGGQGGGKADASGDSARTDAAAGAGGGAGGGGHGGQGGQAAAGGGGQGGEPTCTMPFQNCTGAIPCCSGSMCMGGTCMLIQVSDRNAKQDFARVDSDAILEALARLPISTWSYKSDAPGTRHIGPMAQDFMARFHVGATDKAIFQVDGDGVAFAAIQALDQRVKRLTVENAGLRRQLAQIRAELARDRQARPRARPGAAPN